MRLAPPRDVVPTAFARRCLMAVEVLWLSSNMCANLPVQSMNLTAKALQQLMIVRFAGAIALFLELAHLRLDRGFVDSDDDEMLVRVDSERLAQRGQQVVLVHLRIPLHRVVLDIFGDLA